VNALIVASTLAAFPCLAGMAHADVILTQHTFVGAAKTPTKTVMSIKGGKVRADNDTTSSSIIDTDTGDMTTLMHEQKMAMTMNARSLQAMLPKDSRVKIPQPTLTATGKHEIVDGYDCEIHISEVAGTSVKMWIAKSYPGYDKLKEALKPLARMGGPDAPKMPEVPGMMIKSEFEQSGLKLVTKLAGIEEKKLSDDLFKVPADYKAPAQ
jgi:hypothetical protein